MTLEAPGGNGTDPLDAMRGQVDLIDQQIVDLVISRTALTLAIAQEKASRNIPTMVSGRHNEVIQNYLDETEKGGSVIMTRQNAVALGETVMGISRDAQDRWRADQAAKKTAEQDELANLAAEAAARQQGLL